MDTTPNVVLRGGPADGQTSHVPEPGERISVEDVGGGSITYVDTEQTEEHDGVRLRVYAPRR
ncbi:MAG TPA: hypothetical protein VGD39_16365 [Nocardioides sp.]|jgi:hypothetical protein